MTKALRLFRMVAYLLGKKLFRKGMDRYFELYDGQAVTTENFIYGYGSRGAAKTLLLLKKHGTVRREHPLSMSLLSKTLRKVKSF